MWARPSGGSFACKLGPSGSDGRDRREVAQEIVAGMPVDMGRRRDRRAREQRRAAVGLRRTNSCVPLVPLAPVRFSTKNCWPRSAPSCAASVRAPSGPTSPPRAREGAARAARVQPRIASGQDRVRSVRREAVEESRAAGALEIVLAATPARTARGMRRIPRLRGIVVAQALTVDMAEHDGAGRVARVILARAVLAGREGTAVGLRAGERVVHVGRVAAAVDDAALLVERCLLGELVVGAVQVVDTGGDDLTLGVGPRTLADAV